MAFCPGPPTHVLPGEALGVRVDVRLDFTQNQFVPCGGCPVTVVALVMTASQN